MCTSAGGTRLSGEKYAVLLVTGPRPALYARREKGLFVAGDELDCLLAVRHISIRLSGRNGMVMVWLILRSW